MASDNSESIYDQETLQQLRELVDGDDTSFLDDLFQSYLKTAADSIATLRNDPDNDVLHRAAHTLKGSSLNVGAVGVANVCKQLEADLKHKKAVNMPACLASIEIQLQRVVETYPQTIAGLAAAS